MAFNLGDIFVTFKAKAEGFQAAVGAVQNAAGQVKGVTEKIGAFGQKAEQAGKSMTIGMTLPIVGFGVAAFKTAANFEQTMKQVEVATGAGADSVSKLTKLAEEMGAKTKYSANEAAQAMLELAKGGISEAQIRAGALDATMTLAAAGGISLGNAASYVANSLNTFGLKAKDANGVAAALAGGANASTASVESLGMALSQVGPGAKLAGYSIQETVAALAAFDNAGVKGSDAGTSLKTMLMGLNPRTREAADTMKKLGLDFTDAQGRFLPLRDVAQQLKEKLSGLSDSQKQAALETMFGTDAYRAAAILMNEGADGIDKYTAATSDLGAAQEMAAAMTSGSSGEIEKMMGALETAMKKVGDTIAPMVIKVAKKVGELADKFAKLDPNVQKVVLVILAIVAVMGPMLIVIGKLAMGIKAIGVAFAFLSANPAVLAVTAVILLIAGLAFLIIKNWDTLKRWFMAFWNWNISIVKAVWGFLAPIFAAIGNALISAFKTAWNIIEPIFNAIKFIAQVVFAVIMGIIVVNAIIWQKIFQTFISVVIAIWNSVKGPILAVLNFVGNYIRSSIDAWRRVFNAIVNALSGPFRSAFNFIKSYFNIQMIAFRIFIDKIGSIFSRVAGMISGPFKAGFNAVSAFWNRSIAKMSWRVPDWVPGLGGRSISVPKMPMLAEGGIITSPTMAVVGEGREPEAVIPLSKIGQVAADMNQGGGGQTVINLHLQGAMARSKSELRDIMLEGLTAVDQQLRAQGKRPILEVNP